MSLVASMMKMTEMRREKISSVKRVKNSTMLDNENILFGGEGGKTRTKTGHKPKSAGVGGRGCASIRLGGHHFRLEQAFGAATNRTTLPHRISPTLGEDRTFVPLPFLTESAGVPARVIIALIFQAHTSNPPTSPHREGPRSTVQPTCRAAGRAGSVAAQDQHAPKQEGKVFRTTIQSQDACMWNNACARIILVLPSGTS